MFKSPHLTYYDRGTSLLYLSLLLHNMNLLKGRKGPKIPNLFYIQFQKVFSTIAYVLVDYHFSTH